MHDAAATDVFSRFDHAQDVGDHAGIQQVIRIDEQQPISRGGCRAGIARTADLIDWLEYDFCSCLPDQLRGFFGGIVVYDDDFMGETGFPVGADGFLDRI